MVRPSDWFLVDLSVDPTPGDAFGIRQVASKYSDIAYIAANAASVVRGMRSSHSAQAWVGEAGAVFHSETARMPGELQKADDSYSVVADALTVWAGALEDAQARADRGLALARDAHADLVSAQAALSDAQRSWSVVHAQQLSQQKLAKQYQDVPPPPGVTVPTDAQLRASTRNAQQSKSSMDAASASIASAQARLEAAKRLVLEAKASRDDAERTAVKAIGDAKDKAVKPSSVWEAIQDSAAWQAIVVIATVVLTIVSIVAIFVGGPLVWALIIAATALLMVNALMSIAQGKNAWGELALLAVGLIPGGRALTSAVELTRVFRSGASVGRGLLAVGGHLFSVSKGAILDMARALPRTAVELSAGARSVIRSLPNAAAAARKSATSLISFAHELSGRITSDFQIGAKYGWENHLLEVGRTDPSKAASMWQSGGAYPHADAWHNDLAQVGETYEAGRGGPVSQFAFDGGTTAAHGHDVNSIAEGGQIARSEEFGYRSENYTLQVTSDVPVAHSVVTANSHLGAGGVHQTFFPDINANLQSGQVVVISQFTHHPLPLSFDKFTNSAGDVLHTETTVTFQNGDTMLLHGYPMRDTFPSKESAAAMFDVPRPYVPALGAAEQATRGALRVTAAGVDDSQG